MRITFWRAKPGYLPGTTPTEKNSSYMAYVNGGVSASSDLSPYTAIRWFLSAMEPTRNFFDWIFLRDKPGHIRCYLKETPKHTYLLHVSSPAEKNLSELLRERIPAATTKHMQRKETELESPLDFLQ